MLEGSGAERVIEIGELDREQAEAELLRLIRIAPEREVKLLLFLADRYVALGLAVYGPLEFNDGRNNTIERMMELADEQFYWGKDEFARAERGERQERRRSRRLLRRSSAKWRAHRAITMRGRAFARAMPQ